MAVLWIPVIVLVIMSIVLLMPHLHLKTVLIF